MHGSRPLIAGLCFLLSIAFAVALIFGPEFTDQTFDLLTLPTAAPLVLPVRFTYGLWGISVGWLAMGQAWGLFRAPFDGQWHDMRKPLCLSLAAGCAIPLCSGAIGPVWGVILLWAMMLAGNVALILAPVAQKTWAALPVGFYTGWVTLLAAAALGPLLSEFGGLNDSTAMLITLGLVIILGVFVQTGLRSVPSFGMAIFIALLMLALNSWEDQRLIAATSTIGAFLLLLGILQAIRKG